MACQPRQMIELYITDIGKNIILEIKWRSIVHKKDI